jgi:hypothetical protein
MQSSTKSETECPWLAQLKPWNGQVTYVEHLANHYALMAMNPATIDHARHQSKLLKSDFPTLGILIVEKLRELRNELSSDIHS